MPRYCHVEMIKMGYYHVNIEVISKVGIKAIISEWLLVNTTIETVETVLIRDGSGLVQRKLEDGSRMVEECLRVGLDGFR